MTQIIDPVTQIPILLVLNVLPKLYAAGWNDEQIPETENPPNCPSKKCRSTLWNKGGIDGRTREARIKTGRSRRTTAKKL
jgi:hypothetical protein